MKSKRPALAIDMELKKATEGKQEGPGYSLGTYASAGGPAALNSG